MIGPWEVLNPYTQALGRIREGNRKGGSRIPASSLAGGGGPVGKKLEEHKGYLGVASVGVRVSCSGGSTCAGSQRRAETAEVVLW